MQGKRPRRFIAGAVCPRCARMDKIVLDPETDRRFCVSCGFSEERPSAPAAAELATRVSRAAARRRDTPPQVLNLTDPAADDDRD
ncbi:MAG: YheV family putative metal-binding protein [Halioglobus sp.]|nr:YheV family putative metal-binding protein [Halioglobus sp.]